MKILGAQCSARSRATPTPVGSSSLRPPVLCNCQVNRHAGCIAAASGAAVFDICRAGTVFMLEGKGQLLQLQEAERPSNPAEKCGHFGERKAELCSSQAYLEELSPIDVDILIAIRREF